MPANKNQKSKRKQHHQNNIDKKSNESIKETTVEKSNGTINESEKDVKQLPYKIEKSDIYGRYIVAKNDLKPGETLITEKPLAIGPCVSAEPVCLGCYMPVKLSAAQYKCPTCLWPLCGAQCRGLGQLFGHTRHECELLQTQKTASTLTPQATHTTKKNLYELILIVRILLMKSHDPSTYATILSMESHIELRKQNNELWQHYQKNVVDRLRNDWQMSAEYDEQEIHTICGILDVNCFEIGQKQAKARALYPTAFLLAHDCRPNTAHTDDPETFALYLRTSRRIRRNEPITLSYAYTLQGTLKRRDFMHDGKLFWCQCERCSDPMELGTDCSAIICRICSKGSVRATKPLDQKAEWSCDNCTYKLKAEEVVNILDKINNDLEVIDVHDIPGLENFLKRYTDVLRPNHYLLLSAKYSLCQLYGRIDGYILHNMTTDDIKRKERYCREFLAIIDLLEPGLTRLRGLIMYELHAPIIIIAQRLMQSNSISRQDFQRSLKEVVHLLRESSNILLKEPIGSSEHQMGLAAEDAMNRMGTV